MLGADKIMVELLRFLNGKLHDALRAERVIRIVRRPFRRARNPPDAGLRRLEFDAELREDMRRETLPLMQYAQEQMLGPDMAFPPFQRLPLREFQRRDGMGRELVVHGKFSCPGAPPARISRTTAARFRSISVCDKLSFPARFFR